MLGGLGGKTGRSSSSPLPWRRTERVISGTASAAADTLRNVLRDSLGTLHLLLGVLGVFMGPPSPKSGFLLFGDKGATGLIQFVAGALRFSVDTLTNFSL
ncbi:hypothetical protein D9M68_658260 [compost metagenome]